MGKRIKNARQSLAVIILSEKSRSFVIAGVKLVLKVFHEFQILFPSGGWGQKEEGHLHQRGGEGGGVRDHRPDVHARVFEEPDCPLHK